MKIKYNYKVKAWILLEAIKVETKSPPFFMDMKFLLLKSLTGEFEMDFKAKLYLIFICQNLLRIYLSVTLGAKKLSIERQVMRFLDNINEETDRYT